MRINAVYLFPLKCRPFFFYVTHVAVGFFILSGGTQHSNELKVLSSYSCVVRKKLGKVFIGFDFPERKKKAGTYSRSSLNSILIMQTK